MIKDAGYRIQDTGYRIQDMKNRTHMMIQDKKNDNNHSQSI